MIFLKIFILVKTSLKNRQFGERFVFSTFSENILKIELSPARQAQNAISDFSQKSIFFMQQILKTMFSPAPDAHFCGFAAFEKFEYKNFVFFRKLHFTM